MNEPTPRPKRSLPSNDPFFIASRFAWLYATLEGLGAVVVTLLAMLGRIPAPVVVPLYAVTLAMVLLAKRIKARDVRAAKIAAGIAIVDGVANAAAMLVVATMNPFVLITSVLPIGIRVAFVVQFLQPTRRG